MPAEPELVSASRLDDAELATLFTAAYEGYLVPFVVDENAVRYLTESYDLDREASRVALRDGQPVGLANLGLRGQDAWIGGVGVVPSEQRRGTGRALMRAVQEEARSRGVERVWLEVIVENAGDRSLRTARVRPRPRPRGLVAAGWRRNRHSARGRGGRRAGARLDPRAPHRA